MGFVGDKFTELRRPHRRRQHAEIGELAELFIKTARAVMKPMKAAR
jgi:hypothetical protein